MPSRSPRNALLRVGRRSRCVSSGPASPDVRGGGMSDAAARTAASVHRTIEAVWRMESAKIIGGLSRVLRDVALAEELAHDALVAALEQWPAAGIPDNPGAWLMAAAKHRAVDV